MKLHANHWTYRGITGSEYLHVIIDDYSRLAYAEVLATFDRPRRRRLREPRHRLVPVTARDRRATRGITPGRG